MSTQEKNQMITTITNSDPGRQAGSWGPFSYYEGFGSVDVVRDGGEVPGQARVSMTQHGFVELASTTGRMLDVDADGEVTIWRAQSRGNIRVSLDDSVWIDLPDGSCVGVMPDGRIERVTVGDSVNSNAQSAVNGAADQGSVTQSALEVSAVTDVVPTEKEEQIDWVIAQALAGEEVTRERLAERLAVSVRTAQRRLAEAREKAPEAFAETSDTEDLVQVS